MNTFTKVWEDWVDLNLSLGNCKKSMFKSLLAEGYSYNLIKEKLGIDYVLATHSSTSEQIALRTATKLIARNLEIFKIPNFLTPDECTAIVDIINSSDLADSSTYSASNPTDKKVSEFRTSKTCYFAGKYPLITDVESRICKTLGRNNRFTEQIQGQKYLVGQEFKLHTDYFDPVVLKSNASIRGQRTWTFMIYLNDVEEGGYTSFPYAYVSSKPERGTAVIWNNLDGGGKINVFSSHCGMPILKGEKYILTKWFKMEEINMNVKNEICDHHFLPVFHPVGFEKVKLRLDSIEAIKVWITEQRDGMTEQHDRMMHKNEPVPSELCIKLQTDMQNILTKWIDYKTDLIHVATDVAGDNTQASAGDKTKAISARIHLDSDTPLILTIEDHNFRTHSLTMEYGDILLYESSTCAHTPYEGMYVHFKPVRW